MRATRALICLVALAACATPAQQCVLRESRDLRTVRQLIAETETDIARGYRYQTELRNNPISYGFCTGYPARYSYWGFCGDTAPETIRRPVAIDPEVEARTLAGLRAKEAQLTRQTGAAISACEARYGPALPPQ